MRGLVAPVFCLLICLVGRTSSSSDNDEGLTSPLPEPATSVQPESTNVNEIPNIYNSDFKPTGDITLVPDVIHDESGEGPEEEEAEIEPENQYDWVKFFTGRYYERPYGEINNYLVKSVPLPDVEENLKAAKEFLREETSKKIVLSKRGIVEALDQFTSLEKVLTKSCTWASYAILYKNNRATKGRAHNVPSKTGLLRRIDQVVHDVTVEHAYHCKDEYPKLYNKIRAELNQDDVYRVETFLNLIVNYRLHSKERKGLFGGVQREPSTDAEAIALARQINSIKGDQSAELAYDCLKDFAKNDTDVFFLNRVVDETTAKPIVNAEKVAKVFNRYLVEPCKAFIDAMGPNVYIPMRYDLEIMEQDDRYQLENKDYYNFYTGEVHYNMCNVLLDKSKKFLLKGILKNVSKSTVVTPKQMMPKQDLSKLIKSSVEEQKTQ